MSARIITNAAVGAADWQNEVESKNIGKKGDYNINFSNMYNTSKPVIQAGSSVDIDGQIYVFDINENISGAIGSGSWYVIISAAGNASFINTVPLDYDQAKNGYYTAGGSRYVLGFDGTGSIYSDKYNIERSYFDTPVIMKEGLTVAGAFNIAGNITQTAGVTSLKATTINGRGYIKTGTEALAYGASLDIESTNALGTYVAITEAGSKRWAFGIDDGGTSFKFREDTSSGAVALELTDAGSVLIKGEIDDLINDIQTPSSGRFGNSRSSIWSGGAGAYARWGHKDYNVATNYGFLQQLNSDVFISGGVINMVNNTNFGASINPTTAPLESTVEFTVIGNAPIPRGHYSIEIEIQITVTGGTNPEVYLEQFINGAWSLVDSITGVGLVGVYKSFSGVGFRSSGTDLRIRNPSGNGSYFIRANIRKY